MSATDEDFSALLLNARRNRSLLAPRAEIVPDSQEAADRLSASVVDRLGETVVGWKIGVDAAGKGFGAPILSGGLRASGGEWRRRSLGPLLVEVELAFRLKQDLPLRGSPYEPDEVLAACGSAIAGFELIESRFGDPDGLPFALGLADQLSNAGFVVGAEIPLAARFDLGSLLTRMWVDEQLHAERLGSQSADPWAALTAFARDQSPVWGGLKAGHIITTGAIAPPVRLERPAMVRGEIESIGAVSLSVF